MEELETGLEPKGGEAGAKEEEMNTDHNLNAGDASHRELGLREFLDQLPNDHRMNRERKELVSAMNALTTLVDDHRIELSKWARRVRELL